jgi:hypothetical protein
MRRNKKKTKITSWKRLQLQLLHSQSSHRRRTLFITRRTRPPCHHPLRLGILPIHLAPLRNHRALTRLIPPHLTDIGRIQAEIAALKRQLGVHTIERVGGVLGLVRDGDDARGDVFDLVAKGGDARAAGAEGEEDADALVQRAGAGGAELGGGFDPEVVDGVVLAEAAVEELARGAVDGDGDGGEEGGCR